jgi:uncharacterized protein YjbI with pentapeptide repeats
MIHRGSSNIDFVQGFIGYGNPEGITDWRIANILSGASGNLNIFNSVSQTSRLTILENGNVGIGNTNPGSILEIGGDVNITGVYKKENRDVINDTSNYIATTSNILVPRVLTEVGHGSNYTNRLITALNTRIENTSNYIAGANFLLTNNVSSQWTNVSTGIHYTPTIAQGITITSSPVATTIGTTGLTGEYTYQVFTYTTETAGAGTGQSLYTLNVPTGGVVCDILIVGGGGGGDTDSAGGGGGGAVLYATNINLPTNTYQIKVGNGGNVNVNGKSSEAFGAICLGGGSTPYVAWSTANNGSSGGSGSGGSSGNNTGNGGGVGVSTKGTILSSGTLYNGNIGGNGLGYFDSGGFVVCSGGGGGAGTVGLSSIQTRYTTRNSWIAAGRPASGGDGIPINITGTNYYWGAGGGGGGGGTHSGDGGLGGGGGGGSYAAPAGLGGTGGINDAGNVVIVGGIHTGGNGAPNTGSGGGGGGSAGTGGSGGSGIVIIRYLSSTNVSVTKNVGIGTTNPLTELHVYDDSTNNTIVTVQNNYTDPVIINPLTGYTSAETLESGIYYKTLTFTYSPNYPENPTGTLLLAGYKFNGNGNDDTGIYNLVANSGTPTYSSGTTADSFLQGRRYINTGTGSLRNTSLSLASRAFSIAYWVRHKSTSGTVVVLQTITNSTPSAAFHIGTRSNNGYFLGFLSNDLECGTGVSGNPTTYPGDVNNWVHLVFVVLPNYNRRIYRNGVLIATDANTTACTCSGDLRIGVQFENISQNQDISDLRIYSTGLSATDVATLYASYTSLVITDNYTINFNRSMHVSINSGASTTVNGLYNISLGHINSSVLPAGGQTATPFALTATTSVAIKYELSQLLPNLISVPGATSVTLSSTDRYISFPYTSDSVGLTGQTQYSFTSREALICDILIVGGGGGGGYDRAGGGGAGGLLLYTNASISAGTYTIRVGKGGVGATSYTSRAENGGSSSFDGLSGAIALGGGRGANAGGAVEDNPNAGGSGGGGAGNTGWTANTGGLGTSGQGNKGGNLQGFNSGGGGGAGAVGGDGVSGTNPGNSGNGGIGLNMSSYFGTSVGQSGWFAGGGGGALNYDSFSSSAISTSSRGGQGGGGNAGLARGQGGTSGSSGTGGGGGGGANIPQGIGGAGGSGFVIIRYRKPTSAAIELISRGTLSESPIPGTTITTVPGTFDRCILFPYTSDSVGLTGQTQYTFTTTEALTCDILIVGGGGGGGGNAASGGGGDVIEINNLILPIARYTICVGRGGIGGGSGGTVNSTLGTNGINSSFTGNGINILAGGGGGGWALWTGTNGGNLPVLSYFTHPITGISTPTCGGVGGTGGDYNKNNAKSVANSPSGSGGTSDNALVGGAGGGAAPATLGNGGNSTTSSGGSGGKGVSSSITGTSLEYGGGGGAGSWNLSGLNPAGTATGGAGYQQTDGTFISALNGRGGGGTLSRDGGSGIVIIRYRRTIDNQRIYKVGNYGGDFKVISSVTSGDTDYLRITSAGSSIYNPTGSPLWSTASDKRIKENIEKASYDRCYDSINNLELYRFNYISDFNNINKDRQQLGYIAQEVQGIFPKAVSAEHFYNNNLSIPDLLTIDIAQINYSLYGAVKKIMELDNNKEKRLKNIERLLNIISADTTTSNLTYTDTTTSNLTNTDTTSNLTNTDTTTSNLTYTDTTTSNLTNTDTTTSNLTNTDTTTSNLTNTDTTTSNLTYTDTTTSNLTYTDTTTSNLTNTDTTTSNLTNTDLLTSNNLITDDIPNVNIIM